MYIVYIPDRSNAHCFMLTAHVLFSIFDPVLVVHILCSTATFQICKQNTKTRATNTKRTTTDTAIKAEAKNTTTGVDLTAITTATNSSLKQLQKVYDL